MICNLQTSVEPVCQQLYDLAETQENLRAKPGSYTGIAKSVLANGGREATINRTLHKLRNTKSASTALL